MIFDCFFASSSFVPDTSAKFFHFVVVFDLNKMINAHSFLDYIISTI